MEGRYRNDFLLLFIFASENNPRGRFSFVNNYVLHLYYTLCAHQTPVSVRGEKKSNQIQKKRVPHQIEIQFFKQSLYLLQILCQHKYSLWLVLAYTFSKVSAVKYLWKRKQWYFVTSYFVGPVIIRWLFPLGLRWGLWPCFVALFRSHELEHVCEYLTG